MRSEAVRSSVEKMNQKMKNLKTFDAKHKLRQRALCGCTGQSGAMDLVDEGEIETPDYLQAVLDEKAKKMTMTSV